MCSELDDIRTLQPRIATQDMEGTMMIFICEAWTVGGKGLGTVGLLAQQGSTSW